MEILDFMKLGLRNTIEHRCPTYGPQGRIRPAEQNFWPSKAKLIYVTKDINYYLIKSIENFL
jgi:hypothetical protein